MIPARPPIGRLHVITDTRIQNRFDHVELARMAVAGGATVIQIRDKQLTDAELVSVAKRVLAGCRAAGAMLIVNDRIDVAARAGADGVHLGREDAAIARARRVRGADAVIGGSAGMADEAVEAARAGADYVGFGHVYPTSTKNKPGPPVGLEGLALACSTIEIPVIAIGGITGESAAGALAAGAWGVAVVGAVCAAGDPEAATRTLASCIARSHGDAS